MPTFPLEAPAFLSGVWNRPPWRKRLCLNGRMLRSSWTHSTFPLSNGCQAGMWWLCKAIWDLFLWEYRKASGHMAIHFLLQVKGGKMNDWSELLCQKSKDNWAVRPIKDRRAGMLRPFFMNRKSAKDSLYSSLETFLFMSQCINLDKAKHNNGHSQVPHRCAVGAVNKIPQAWPEWWEKNREVGGNRW